MRCVACPWRPHWRLPGTPARRLLWRQAAKASSAPVTPAHPPPLFSCKLHPSPPPTVQLQASRQGCAGGARLTLGDLVAGLEGGPQRQGPLARQVQRLQRRSAPVEPLLPGPIRARQQRKAG